jgi:hypothetical protein
MLSVTLQIVMAVGFIALIVLIWRVSRRPRWRVRSVIYGWAAVFLYALLCAAILPMGLRGVMDAHTIAETFPDGTIAIAALVGGWFWPLIVVLIGHRTSGSEKT